MSMSMANSIFGLHQVIRAKTTKLYVVIALGALGSACLWLKRTNKFQSTRLWTTPSITARHRERSSLNTLPIDVIIEIFLYLNCADIVRVRRVCRHLCSATKERFVWLRLFRLDAHDPSRRRIFLDKTLETHSAVELETVVLKPHKADFAWTNRDPDMREVGITHQHELLRILPGGRWCLARSKASVLCYDLSDTTAGRRPAHHFLLASNPLPRAPGTRFEDPPEVDVDVDTTTPYLTFNFAVYFSRSDLDLPDGATTDDHPILQVWKVTPCFDDRGRIHKLASQHLRTFHRPQDGACCFLQIRNQYIAVLEGWNPDSVVFDWVNTPAHIHASLPLTNRDEDNFQHALPRESAPQTLLPRHRVLSYSGSTVFVCGIPPSVPPPSIFDLPALPVLWQVELPDYCSFDFYSIRGPFHGVDADVFILVGYDDVPCSLLTIPRDFTSTEHPNKPSVDSVGHLQQLFDLSFDFGWGTRRFTFLHQVHEDDEDLLLRRSSIPDPLRSPLTCTDIVCNDFSIPLEHLRTSGLDYTNRPMLDDCSCTVGLEVHTTKRVFVLLFEHN